jgi:hypothetical protein
MKNKEEGQHHIRGIQKVALIRMTANRVACGQWRIERPKRPDIRRGAEFVKYSMLALCICLFNCAKKPAPSKYLDLQFVQQLPVVSNDSLLTLIKSNTDKIMNRNGFQLNHLSSQIFEDSLHFVAVYTFTRKNSKGGGGVLVLQKPTLNLVAQKLEE